MWHSDAVLGVLTSSFSPLGTQRSARCPGGAWPAGQAGEWGQPCWDSGAAWGGGAESGGAGEGKGEGRKEVGWRERSALGGGGGWGVIFLWRMELCAPPGTWPHPYCYSYHHPCSHPHLHPTPIPGAHLSVPQGPKGDVGVSGEQGVPGPPVTYLCLFAALLPECWGCAWPQMWGGTMLTCPCLLGPGQHHHPLHLLRATMGGSQSTARWGPQRWCCMVAG